MKNRFLYIALCAAGILGGATSCNDYLETKSPSTNDADFVFSNITTAQAALNVLPESAPLDHGAHGGNHLVDEGKAASGLFTQGKTVPQQQCGEQGDQKPDLVADLNALFLLFHSNNSLITERFWKRGNI